MEDPDPAPQPNEDLIEENLKKAFSEKAKEDVPKELLDLLEQLRQQETKGESGE